MSDYIVVGCCPRHLINNNSSNSRQQQCWWMGGVVRWCRRVRGHQTSAALYPPCKHWNQALQCIVGAVWPNNWILCKVFGHFINDTFYVFPPHLIPFVIWVGLLVQRIFCLFRMVQLNQLSFWIILLADTHNAANNGAARVHSAACTL